MAVTTSLRSWNDYNASIGFIVFVVHLTRISWRSVYLALSLFLLGYFFLEQVMESLSSSASTVPSFDDFFAHNMWNPLLELLFLEQVSGIFASFVVEIDLAQIALSCHFALDLLCFKEGAFSFGMTFHRAPFPWSFLFFYVAPSPPLWHRVLFGVHAFATKCLLLSWYGGHPSLRYVHIRMM